MPMPNWPLSPWHEAAVKRAQAHQETNKLAMRWRSLQRIAKHAAADIPQFALASSDGFYQAQFAVELSTKSEKRWYPRGIWKSAMILGSRTPPTKTNDFPEPVPSPWTWKCGPSPAWIAAAILPCSGTRVNLKDTFMVQRCALVSTVRSLALAVCTGPLNEGPVQPNGEIRTGASLTTMNQNSPRTRRSFSQVIQG